MDKDILQKLKTDGYYIIDSFFNDDEINIIKTELLEFYNKIPDYASLYDGINVDLSSYSFGKHLRMSSIDYLPKFKKIFLEKNFSPLTKNYLGINCKENIQVFSTFEYINSTTTKSKPRNSFWHFDPYESLKYFIYITDANLENGCLRIIPGTKKITQNLRKKISFEEITQEGYKVEHLIDSLQDEIINLEGKKGSVVIFDTDTFHVGSNLLNNNLERMVLIVHNRP